MQKLKQTALIFFLLFCALAALALLSGCVPSVPAAAETATPAVAPTLDPDSPVSSDDPTPTPGAKPRPGDSIAGENAIVEELDVLLLESFPLQANAIVRGQLRDGCTEVDRVESARDGNTFHIRVFTRRPAEGLCTQALVPFEAHVALDILGLPAGEYTVQAYDVSRTFTLDVDNVLQADPALSECSAAAPGAPVYTNEVNRYCFAYPEDFESLIPEGPVDVIVRGPQYGEGPQPLTAEVVIGVLGRTGQSLEEFVAGMTGESTGVELERQDITLGGEPAVVIDNLPGAGPNRVVVSARGGTIFTLTFQPLESPDRPEIAADIQRLYERVIATWAWLD
ncbi:MAG TPA: hypothetical protein VFF68_06805 [Anaerolineaceae bacterium]|nr:hypothetical protein [Anaerolineaceae bacterium]